ncbi:MAG TPA: glycosyltransferase, partial [Deinococcales bacterium]|nr:glycosyltransferase [Deinococcales bacterium]
MAHDWLVTYGGSEAVLETLLRAFPVERVHTSVYDRAAFRNSVIARQDVRASFIDRLPGARHHHRQFLPLMPLAVEQYDLRSADVVLSNACALAHGVITRPDQAHVAYFNRTMTYAWDTYLDDLEAFGVARGLKGLIARRAYHSLRQWDFQAGQRPDVLVANSRYAAARIWKHYRREALVIPPPVMLDPQPNFGERGDAFVLVGRLVPVKRPDVVVEAFNRLRLPLEVIGDGPLRASLRARAGPNVRFLGALDRPALYRAVREARGLVLASEENFGLVSVEAQSSGTPVVALARGGSLETVKPGVTGLLFDAPTPEAVQAAVLDLIRTPERFP